MPNSENINKLIIRLQSISDEQFDIQQPHLVEGCGCIMAHGYGLMEPDENQCAALAFWLDCPIEQYGDLLSPHGYLEPDAQRRFTRKAAIHTLEILRDEGTVRWEV